VSQGLEGVRKAAREHVECYWRKMLSSRSWKGTVWWQQFQQIQARFPLLRPKLYLPYGDLQALVML
jgi:RNA-directed DNA polymerase